MKNKDDSRGNWIECNVCCMVIRVWTTFEFTEWENRCTSLNYCQKIKEKLLTGNMSKLRSYSLTTRSSNNEEISTIFKFNPNKRNKLVMPCLGLIYGKNSELLQLYKKYKKKDTLNESIFIHYKDGIHSGYNRL